MSTDSKEIVPVCEAFDIETKGGSYDDPIIQIGIAWGTSLKDIQKASFCFDHKDQPFEERCFREFWSKHRHTYDRIVNDAKAHGPQWVAFADFLRKMDDLYPKIKIVSDNPAFDFARIDNELHERGLRVREQQMTFGTTTDLVHEVSYGLRYTKEGQYRVVCDPSERIKGLPKAIQTEIQAKVAEAVKEPHWAPDDATGILVQYFLVKEAIEKMNSAVTAA
jgi:hypothetical protein